MFKFSYGVCVGEAADTEGPLEADKPLSELRQEPLALPGGFEWESLDINDPKMVRLCAWLE